jgi:hypothetical protein
VEEAEGKRLSKLGKVRSMVGSIYPHLTLAKPQPIHGM